MRSKLKVGLTMNRENFIAGLSEVSVMLFVQQSFLPKMALL